MPLLVIKLMENDNPADLKAAAETYMAGVPTDAVRDMDADQFLANDQDTNGVLAMAHGGIDTPANGAGTAAAQLLAVDSDKLAGAQAAVDAALADVVHETVGDGDTTVAGTITTTTPLFTTGAPSEDIGRKVRIGSEERTITAVASTTSASYDDAAEGAFTSGSGLTTSLLGAESIQAGTLSLTCHKAKDQDTVFSVRAVVEGDLPA